MNLRITIEIDGRELVATTLQPPSSSEDRPTGSTSSMAYAGTTVPPEVLARAEALGATDAGPAYGGAVGFGAGMLGTPARECLRLEMPCPQLLLGRRTPAQLPRTLKNRTDSSITVAPQLTLARKVPMNLNLLCIQCLVGLLLSVAAVCQQVAYAQAPITVYRLMCDASAAVALDADHFVVANDERNQLQIYKRDTAHPVKSVDISSFSGPSPRRNLTWKALLRLGSASIGSRRMGETRTLSIKSDVTASLRRTCRQGQEV